jgi:hypothetical protein
MKAYVTKYALSKGILEIDGEVFADGKGMKWGSYFNSAYGNDWHKTLVEAKQRANEMRLAKIESLKKQIVKLEKMTFDKVTI